MPSTGTDEETVRGGRKREAKVVQVHANPSDFSPRYVCVAPFDGVRINVLIITALRTGDGMDARTRARL